MSQHIFTFFRNFRLSRALKSLPLQHFRLVTPEPQSTPAIPQGDAWLFAEPASVSAHVEALSGEMTRVSDALSNLHLLVSRISGQAYAEEPAETLPISGRIWSDALLFDGEPLSSSSPAQSIEADAFLFDDEDEFSMDAELDTQPVQMPIPHDIGPRADAYINL